MRTTAVLSRDPAAPFTVETVDLDAPRDDEILVRIQASGICHTDLVNRVVGRTDRPVLLGHEGAGIVAAVGAAVTAVAPGDHVVLTFRHCGTCPNCATGRPAYCRQSTALNHFGRRADSSPRVTVGGNPVRDGFFGQSSFAGYALATADNTIVVDPASDPAVVASFGCGFQTGAGAVLNVLRPDSGSWLAIYGGGAVGSAALLAARTIPGVRTIVVETAAARRALAGELGADHVLDPSGTDIAGAVREITGGGATHALDTTGIPTVLADAFAALTTGATVVAVGLGSGIPPIDVRDMVLQGKTIRGCLEGDAEPARFIPHLLDLYGRGLLPVDRLVTRFHYADIEAALAAQHAGTVVKPVLTW
ncbi:NAD(P)-dependent alcohol dehydrogenase [Nocardia sp. NPDC019395]|uniref:NAD(P)-dependent alcohol dehydrogenase n=1 Tax=Nocardia sp. NPDC019395 TaxID=3154686 RepID=UPI0033E54C9E